MSDNWKKSMDTLINEVGEMKAYLENDEKNKLENFIGLLNEVKAISLSSNKGGGQRGGTRMPDGSYVCNTCGSRFIPTTLLQVKMEINIFILLPTVVDYVITIIARDEIQEIEETVEIKSGVNR